MLRNLCFVLLSLTLIACGGGSRADGPATPADVNDLLLLRHYDMPTNERAPQPAWSPNGRWLMVRSERSLLLMREGGRRRHRVHGGRRPDHAVWLDNDLIAFGPEDWVTITSEGRLVLPSEGIRLLEVDGDGNIGSQEDIAEGAWRPQRWGDKIIAQRASSIFLYDRHGNGELYDEGYFPAPHPRGRGIAIQTTPMIATDYWTGHKGLGNLVVRWPNGVVNIFPGLVEAQWCGDGAIIATRLRAKPENLERWWEVGCDVVTIAGPDAEPQLVMADAYHPSSHPIEPIIAVTGPSDRIFICNRDGSYQREVVDGARAAYWSPDGSRLAVERPDIGTGLIDMRFLLFKRK